MNEYGDLDYPEDGYDDFNFDDWYSDSVRGIREECNRLVEDGYLTEDEAELQFLEDVEKLFKNIDPDDW